MRKNKDEFCLFEKIIICLFAIPYDFIEASGFYKCIRKKSVFFFKKEEGFLRRFYSMQKQKIQKAETILRIKRNSNHGIPKKVKKICFKTACGILRYYVVELK